MVAIAALAVQTTTVPRVKRKKRYRAQLEASGGVAPYTWKRTKRSLPKGLKLTRSGVIQGKAKARATKKVRVHVTDSAGTRRAVWIRIRVR